MSAIPSRYDFVKHRVIQWQSVAPRSISMTSYNAQIHDDVAIFPVHYVQLQLMRLAICEDCITAV